MTKSIKISLLRSISNVCDISAEEGLSSKTLQKLDAELSFLAGYFSITQPQAWLLAMIFGLHFKNSTVDVSDIAGASKSNPLRILEYSDDIQVLIDRGFVKKVSSPNPYRNSTKIDQMIPNKEVTDAILNNQPLPENIRPVFDELTDLLERIYILGVDRDNEEMSTEGLFAETREIITTNMHMSFIKEIRDKNMDIKNTYFYLYIVWKTISGYGRVSLHRACEGIFDRESARVKFLQAIISGQADIVKESLIEVEEGGFMNDTEVFLSQHAIDQIEKHGLKILRKQKKYQNVQKPGTIAQRTLYYNQEEEKQLDMIRGLMEEHNLQQMIQRLKSKNMPEGMTILLHGAPGTGKTETVYQLARLSEREIMKVDISKTRSMWFGESERLVRQIFNDYRDFKKNAIRCPILLFNEADAIISKRMESVDSSVKQTENAIQNILLEELESFSGIFFATTNLVQNLDQAFDRRFLFKVCFTLPDAEKRALIWQSKLTHMDAEGCRQLAAQFSFSGGQIDNIARKCEMAYVISGTMPDYNEIVKYCNVERLPGSGRRKIGFI